VSKTVDTHNTHNTHSTQHTHTHTYLCGVEVNVEVDELAVLLDEVLDVVRLQEVRGLVLEEEADTRAAAQLLVRAGVLDHGERGGVGGPDVLLVIVVLGGHDDRVGDQEGGVEADTELADQVGRVRNARVLCGWEESGSERGEGRG
jgi:hypothetical protein